MKAKTADFGWPRLGTVAGILGLSMILIWRLARGTTSPFIYFASTPPTVLVQWWLAFGLFENLWGGSAAKPRIASWVAAIETPKGQGFWTIARRWIISAVKSAALVYALTLFLRIPLDFMGSVVVGMALASLAVAFGLGGGLVATTSKKARKIVRGVMLAILASSLIVWIVECLELNLIPGEPLRALSILLLSGGWHWFFPSQWILGIGEGLVNGSTLLPYLLGPFGLAGLMVAMYLGALGQRRTIPSSPGIKKLPGDRRDKARHSKFPFRAVKAVAVMMLFSIACSNQETSQPSKTATSGPEPKALPGVAVPSKLFEERQPGAVKMSRSIRVKIEEAWNRREQDYIPRTRHLHSEKVPKYTNRLFLETSPYLMQHAHNPVDWFAWGDEAFETARKLGRPVFLSVGYSTCHWCHVMEEESFEDEEIARFMNENYISIKVDREERPDVDAIYMNAVQTLTGRGGWPMSVWLTPDRKPFYGGTYFPARDGDRGSSTGFLTLLDRLKDLYDDDPDRVIETSTRLVESIQRNLSAPPGGTSALKDSILKRAAESYVRGFDSTYGGINRAPKFPSSLPVRFLLRDHRRTGNKKSLSMAVLTLEKMAAGGMYDHVGGGFHRYSTDRRWLVPHFEKMLYDNALLTVAYLEGYQVTGRTDFAQVAQEILRYVARDMTSPEGAFYSATDADSPVPGQGRRDEGWFFTWTPDEIDAVLGSEKARLVKEYYVVTNRGNFEGRSILNTPISLVEVAKKLGMSETDAQFEILEAKDLLYEVRALRPPPLRDEKILAAWNGLMISAHARAAIVLADKSYATRAAKAADFVLTQMRRDGRLFRSYKNGQPRHNGYLADYAFMIAGVLDLFEATGDPRWLKEAMEMEEVLEKHFVDKSAGGYFMISDDHEKLLARQKPGYDGAEPTGNSVHALNLLRLYEFTTQDRYRQRGEKTLKAFGQTLERSAGALSEMLLALDFYLDTPLEIVIVTSKDKSEAEPFLKKLRSTFLPNRVFTIANEGEEVAAQAVVMPLIGGKTTMSGKATAYVCEQGVCELPTSDPEVFAKQISKIRRSIN